MLKKDKHLSDVEFISVMEMSAQSRILRGWENIRRHEAAGMGRRHPRENDHSGFANTAIGAEGGILSRRALNMDGNNGFAHQAKRVSANGIVGTGSRPSVRTKDKKLEKKILQFWGDATHSAKIDHNGHENLNGLAHQVHDAMFTTGDAIIRRRRQRDGSFKLQVHEGDYLDMSMHGVTNDSGGYTMHGIDYDAQGQVTGYWLFDSLDDGVAWQTVNSRKIPAADVLHCYYADRAGQRRGLPWLRSVYVALMDLTRYMDADLQRSIVAACHAVFVEGSSDNLGLPGAVVREEFDRIQPGDVYYLNNGEKITSNQPPVHNTFPEYVRSILRLIASGAGLTYESISGDFSQVNFASAKMAANEMDRNFAEKRERTMLKFYNGVWSWFMESLALQGLVPMTVKEAVKIEADWTAPRRAMIDMVKETEGLRLQVAAGLISWQEAVRMCGGDPDDVAEEQMTAIEIMGKIGFVPTWLVPTTELNELAIEGEAKTTTANAAKKQAEKAVAAANKAAKAPKTPQNTAVPK